MQRSGPKTSLANHADSGESSNLRGPRRFLTSSKLEMIWAMHKISSFVLFPWKALITKQEHPFPSRLNRFCTLTWSLQAYSTYVSRTSSARHCINLHVSNTCSKTSQELMRNQKPCHHGVDSLRAVARRFLQMVQENRNVGCWFVWNTVFFPSWNLDQNRTVAVEQWPTIPSTQTAQLSKNRKIPNLKRKIIQIMGRPAMMLEYNQRTIRHHFNLQNL